ncbi:MAG: hypothetical protein IKC64_05730 [Clostridia bacterium]|nr:hypothetical protein [Clostridia bacterium]
MKYYQKWQGRSVNRGEWFNAIVPGNIQFDYAKANGFLDHQYAYNCEQFNEIEDDTFEYKATLDFCASKDDKIYFVSEGIDYAYQIYLDGELLYAHEGLYSPVELDVTDKVKCESELIVRILPHPKTTTGRVGTRDEADQSVKPALQYGWDFQPRLIVSGMWQNAYIETRDKDFVKCEVFTSLSDDFTVGEVNFDIKCKNSPVVTVFSPDNEIVYSGTDKKITIQNPKLWWCNGQGDPNLYRYQVKNGNNETNGTFAFRRIKLVRNEGAIDPDGFPKSRYAPPVTIELNGRRIFAKGSNWVFPEIFFGNVAADAIYLTQIGLAKNANMNILRVHGGAGMQRDVFYDECDRLGIMVWQEFPLACNDYRDGKDYLEVLNIEATAMIKRLRSHPCLAIWCGGNELFNGWSGMTEQSGALRLLNKLCYELDRNTPYINTSPLFLMAHGGYEFYIPELDNDVFTIFSSAHNIAYPEFGVASATTLENLKRIIPNDEIYPPTPTKSWLIHHGFMAWKKHSHLYLNTLEKYFGKANSIEDIIYQSQLLQSIGYQAIFEEARKQWPYCSIALNWCFNEPWITAANNSIIAYPHTPKPAYNAVKNALRPTLFSARIKKFTFSANETFEAELWLLNDTQGVVTDVVKAVLVVGEEEIELIDWKATANVNANMQGPTVRCVLPNVDTDRITLKLIAKNGRENEYYLHYTPNRKVLNTRALNNAE